MSRTAEHPDTVDAVSDRRHGPRDWMLAGAAWLLLGVARLLLLRLSFKRLMHLAGYRLEPVAVRQPQPMPVNLERPTLGRVAWAIQAASLRTPWESKCFAQALAAGILLRWRSLPTRIYFGVRPANPHESRAMTAHAWLTCQGRIITGAAGHEDFTVVATYARQPSLTELT